MASFKIGGTDRERYLQKGCSGTVLAVDGSCHRLGAILFLASLCFFVSNSDGLQPNSDVLQSNSVGLQLHSDGLQPNSDDLQLSFFMPRVWPLLPAKPSAPFLCGEELPGHAASQFGPCRFDCSTDVADPHETIPVHLLTYCIQ